ncbi:MAG: DUF4387 family protein [Spirochaetales bacterium]|nr:DUF4387 family protein [Spirochaetales bacterium]
MSKTIEQTVRAIRSKNAGPFWVTIDAFCDNAEDTALVSASFTRNKALIAKIFNVRESLVKIFTLTHIHVVKVSVPRIPIEGARDEKDMHGGQQYVSLLDLEV